ncbi:hypothetical protein SLE2022_180360 [Rubroshorea leprosula]
MALVSPSPVMSSMAIHGVPAPGIMTSRRDLVDESMALVIEEKIYVALGKEIEKNKSVLRFAIRMSRGRRLCIIHVHQRAQRIPVPIGAKVPVKSLDEQQVMDYWETEKQSMLGNLNQYLHLCSREGVRAEKDYIEMDSVEKGILELISKNGIRKLVMGAAADKYHSKYEKRKLKDLKSKKAISVRDQAPASCKIWFVCGGIPIHVRGGTLDDSDTELPSPLSQASPSIEAEGNNHFRTQSARIPTGQASPSHLTIGYRRSATFGGNSSGLSTLSRLSTPRSRSDSEEGADESDILTRGNVLAYSFNVIADAPLVPSVGTQGIESGLESTSLHLFNNDLHQSSPPSDGSMVGGPYDQVMQMMKKAANSRREACEEALSRAKAEEDAIEAIHRVKASEVLYSEELKLRKEIEEALRKVKGELDEMKNKRDEVMEALQIALNQTSLLENQVAESEHMVKDLEEKIIAAVELLQNYKKERDELQMERDNALNEAEELRKSRAEASSVHVHQFVTEFSFSDIVAATNNFDPSLKIGEGGYGSIYKGILRHTQVAIKMLNADSLQGPSEFQQEVDILSKMRHPNLVTLIGACPEAWVLIYEYLPSGNLEDRLSCKDNSPPLPWQTRIRIATELCSVLIFLHSCKPQGIVHGDLKPANILLDANFVSKLGDFGLCRLLSDKSVICRTSPKGTFGYLDPEFYATGELTPKSDVYSFGIILLQLLTGRGARGIAKEVQYAIDKKALNNLLDPLAGDWPFVQAEQLANLALRCCQMDRKNRPDLETEVWRVLEPMRASCGGFSSSGLGSGVQFQAPSYFICPIFQEIMQDPQVAADGFTYEAEALRGWLDSGNDTSPMTSLPLSHSELIPNLALRSAIKEWLQQQ